MVRESDGADGWEKRAIPLKELILWSENARIPDYLLSAKEEEVLATLLEKYNVTDLAREIVKDIDMPQLERIVVVPYENRFIVLEGNRRIAAYKCLVSPSITKDSALRTHFEILASGTRLTDNTKIDAVIAPSKEQGLRYVDRKHYHGNNEEPWIQRERDRYISRKTTEEERGQLSAKVRSSLFRANLAELVEKEVQMPIEMKQRILGQGFATTFYRVVGSEMGEKYLKYENVDGDVKPQDKRNFKALLKVVIYNLLSKERFSGKRLDSRALNSSEDIAHYLKSITVNDAVRVEKLIAAEARAKAKSNGRKILSSRGLLGRRVDTSKLIDTQEQIPALANEKIREIFAELQRINVSECPHACAVLLRILLELTCTEFLRTKGVLSLQVGKNTLQVQDAELRVKIETIRDRFVADKDMVNLINHLQQKELLTKKLNMVVHSAIFSASESEIKAIWKNLRKFLDLLFQQLPKQRRA